MRQRKLISAHQIRATVLVHLGFKSYDEYLNSDLWKNIRLRVLQRDNNKCRACGQQAWQVHHKSYRVHTMQGKTLEQLISICGTCHENIEFENGNKLTIGQANQKVESIIKTGKALDRYCPSCVTCGKPLTGQLRKRKGVSKCRGCVKIEHNRFIRYCRRS